MAVKYRRVSPDMRVGRQSADISTESRPTYRPSIGRYIDRLSADISADCRSTYRPRVSTDTRSTDALSTHDPTSLLNLVAIRKLLKENVFPFVALSENIYNLVHAVNNRPL